MHTFQAKLKHLKHMLCRHWPVKSHFVPQFPLMDVAVQNIIADVGCGTFHALHVNFTLGYVEIVVQKLPGVFCLPEKIFGNISPELWTQEEEHTRTLMHSWFITEIQSKTINKTPSYQQRVTFKTKLKCVVFSRKCMWRCNVFFFLSI